MYIFINPLLICLILLLSACDSSSPESTPETDGVITAPVVANPVIKSSTATTFLPYGINNSGDKITQIGVVNITTPSEFALLETNPDNATLGWWLPSFQTGTYVRALSQISNYRTYAYLYEKNNQFFSFKTDNVSSLQAHRVSSENNVSLICQTYAARGNDYANPAQSRLVYKKRIQESDDCFNAASGTWHFISLDDTETTSPRNIASLNFIIDPINDPDTGALVGWLGIDVNNNVVKYSLDFQTSAIVSITNLNTTTLNAWLLLRTKQSYWLLNVNQSLYLYDPLSNTILSYLGTGQSIYDGSQSTFQHKSPYGWHLYASDGNNIYFFAKTSGNNFNLYRLALDGQSAPALMTSIAASSIGFTFVTDSSVVYTTEVSEQHPRGAQIYRLNKTANNQIPQLIAIPTGYGCLYDAYASGSTFIADITNKPHCAESSFQDLHATIQLFDGNNTPQLNSNMRLMGATYSSTRDLTRAHNIVSHIITASPDTSNNATHFYGMQLSPMLHTFDMGTLGNDVFSPSLKFDYAQGRNFGLIQMRTGGSINNDIFFYNMETATITQITKTSSSNEITLAQ